MHAIQKEFSERLVDSVEVAKLRAISRYKVVPINNANLVCEKLYKMRELTDSAVYVECGVFRGYTILPVALFLQQENINFNMIGFDSFEGFPDGILSPLDFPTYFKSLLRDGEITPAHFDKAKKKTSNFKDTQQLQAGEFVDLRGVFEHVSDFKNISLIKGAFSETLDKIDNDIAVLFLDCDLYKSYLECLCTLYPLVVSGGAIIFDEYYSLKYPGPRAAVNSFFQDKVGHFEWYVTSEGFERWCFIKEE